MATQSGSTPFTPVAVLGQGRAGRDLVRLLRDAGVARLRIWTRAHGPLPEELEARTVILAVPDGAIAELAASLAAAGCLQPDAVLLHLSGALDASPLRAACPGHPAASAHPLQTFVGDGQVRRPFPWVLEGDAAAVVAATALTSILGCPSVELPAADRARYHAAATVASNLLVALADLASRQAALAGVPADQLPALFTPLMHTTLDNLARRGAADALTGPVARGDVRTVQAHLEALADTPDDRRCYQHLSRPLVDLAEQRGLDPDSARTLRSLLAPPPDCGSPEGD